MFQKLKQFHMHPYRLGNSDAMGILLTLIKNVYVYMFPVSIFFFQNEDKQEGYTYALMPWSMDQSGKYQIIGRR